MALHLEVEISTAIPDLTPPNYSCLEEDSVFVNQRTEIQHDLTGVGHVSTFTQSLWWGGVELACSDWLSLGHVLQT